MTNPFLGSGPHPHPFWNEQAYACEEARRLLVKTPEFGAFLAAGGTLAVVPDGFPAKGYFAALLKDEDTVYASVSFISLHGELHLGMRTTNDVQQLTAWLTEARDGAKPSPEEPFGFTSNHTLS